MDVRDVRKEEIGDGLRFYVGFDGPLTEAQKEECRETLMTFLEERVLQGVRQMIVRYPISLGLCDGMHCILDRESNISLLIHTLAYKLTTPALAA